MRLFLDDFPDTSANRDDPICNHLAMASMAAAVALPASGGLVTAIVSFPFLISTSLREDLGNTLMSMSNSHLRRNTVQVPGPASEDTPVNFRSRAANTSAGDK